MSRRLARRSLAYTFATCARRTPPLFFFNTTATTEIYTLSLHDALPILLTTGYDETAHLQEHVHEVLIDWRSEEHTSELQSRVDLVCRLLLEKKKDRGMRRGIAHHRER